MSRRLQIPGEREQAELIAACQRALEVAKTPGSREAWPEPDSYLAADQALLGLPVEAAALEALWTLQNPDLGFPVCPGSPSCVDTSAKVWAALRLSGVTGGRLAQLGAAVRSMGGVDAFHELTKTEWALAGLIPPDRVAPSASPAAIVLQSRDRAGAGRLTLDLAEIGGCGQPAAPKATGLKAWWARAFGTRHRAIPTLLDDLRREALGGSALDPRTRAAWLAAACAGRKLDPPRPTPPPAHDEWFQSGVDATLAVQQPDGSWRDGEGAIHGTWRALAALRRGGYDDREAEVLRGGEWLRSTQNADGGWSEDSTSTVSHTAWAVMGLIEGGDPASESVTKGIEFLLARQTPEGWWRERAWTRIICPGLAYARDEARSHRDAVQAIEKFMQATIRGTNG
jgi:hypothetical protein